MRISDWSSDVCSSDLKQSVTLTIVPSSVSALQVFRPSIVSGTLIATLSAILRRISASFIIVSWSSATTSAETGPEVIEQISATRSEEHTSELQSLMRISYAVFCLKKKKKIEINKYQTTKIL